MNQSNRPYRSGLSPAQEQQRAAWQQYAAEEQRRHQAAIESQRRARAEAARRAEEERRREMAERRKFLRDCFELYLIFLVLILVITAAIFFLSLHRTDIEPTPAQYRYTVGGVWNEAKKTVDEPLAAFTLTAEDACVDGIPYLPMTTLAKLAALQVTGSRTIQKFATEAGEYVRFTADSATAEINGEQLTLDAPARLHALQGEEILWVPANFVTDWMEGITVDYDAEQAAYRLSLDAAKPVAFLLKGGAPLVAINEKGEFGDTPAIAFEADLRAYEKYMNPEDRNAYLTLINTSNKLDSSYIPPDLINIADTRKDGRNTQQMREYAAKALEALFIEMRACGITGVSVTSGYRAYSYQVQLFDQRVAMYPSLPREEAEAKAATVVAIPGSSEHQSGLCIDMHNLASADVKFGQTAAFDWISKNAHKFGFILRYPEDKVAVTGISYEPWHYRYVGRYHAMRIYESGLCLEEYVAKYIEKSEGQLSTQP